ncbi:hypothetical protein N7516_008237 [Penicillium verrucosum]|uniref:uncharacterized protein n=1 Tax=Penicillium verrucosum TaxID=60171 RepID=UPI0025451E93|nr:uncharacterized protein N7516_008237 [Penicillium verrucosum]KAJ5926464.1 hypothetical protein N7516_008237 [Penicillium verrucosum]
MRFSTILSLLPLALSVAAVNITEPAKGADVDVSGSFTVKWTSVNTDASTVDIVLINNAVYPTVSEKIASGIDTSKGSYTASGLKGINLLSTDAKNTGILAQSEQFDVSEAKSSSATTTASGSSTSSTGTSTGTQTSTQTGLTTSASSTGTATGSAAASATPSTGAAMGLVAPGAAAGLLAGVLALL